jgi:hypothetical protein
MKTLYLESDSYDLGVEYSPRGMEFNLKICSPWLAFGLSAKRVNPFADADCS